VKNGHIWFLSNHLMKFTRTNLCFSFFFWLQLRCNEICKQNQQRLTSLCIFLILLNRVPKRDTKVSPEDAGVAVVGTNTHSHSHKRTPSTSKYSCLSWQLLITLYMFRGPTSLLLHELTTGLSLSHSHSHSRGGPKDDDDDAGSASISSLPPLG